jgi:hypothetical protein
LTPRCHHIDEDNVGLLAAFKETDLILHTEANLAGLEEREIDGYVATGAGEGRRCRRGS